MNLQELYASKLVSADTAAAVVKSGDWVDYGWCVGTPFAVDKAIAKRLPSLTDVNFRGGVIMRRPAVFDIENPAEHMTWNSWHMSGIERKAIAGGFGYFAPMRYAELPRFYRDINAPKPDVAILQVSPMDEHGYFSFGPQASHLAAVCEAAKILIVEVNKNQPYCHGGFEHAVHISRVDMIVEGENEALPQLPAGGAASEVDKAVAKLIVEDRKSVV